jgi:hypothetical protein
MQKLLQFVVAGVIVVLLHTLAVSLAVVAAQDVALATNTPTGGMGMDSDFGVVTDMVDAGPMLEREDVYAIVIVLSLLVIGILSAARERNVSKLIESVNRAMDNKVIRDQAELRYFESSLPTQEFIKMLASFATVLGSLNIPGVDPLADKAADFLQDVTTKNAPSVDGSNAGGK